MNSAGLSTDLLESELLGHDRGAFTGAVAAKPGLLELAHRGTLFLDEIGDIDAAAQAKLLKVIEEFRFRRLGEVRDREVDVRLIAATHRDLPAMVAAGRFREDLYFRIHTLPLTMPPLRERGEDVVLIARSLLARIAGDLGRPALRLSAATEEALLRRRWPGNVRELRNVLEHAALLAPADEIAPEDLTPDTLRGAAWQRGAGGTALSSDAIPAFRWTEAPRPPNDGEFHLFRDLIYGEAGIHLSRGKTALLASRLVRRVRELGLRSFREYYAIVKADPEERTRMLERVCTHETHFFREPRQFEFLRQRLVPEWRRLAAAGHRQPRVRCWSAGCSSGEEPYSLAMLLLSELPLEAGWQIEILATDLSAAVLERARRGVWPLGRAGEIPVEYRQRFMLKGQRSRRGLMRAGEERG